MTTAEHTLDFSDYTPIEIPFEVLGRQYLLKEASAGAVKEYNNERMRRLTFGAGGRVTSTRDLADLEPLLLSRCCVRLPNKEPVPIKEVEGWPNRIKTPVYDMARKISGISKQEEETKQTTETLDLLIHVLRGKDPQHSFPMDWATFFEFVEELPAEPYKPLKDAVRKEENVKEH